MLAARNPSLGTIELPTQESLTSGPASTHQDETLAELFQRLGQGEKVFVLANPVRSGLAISPRRNDFTVSRGHDYAPADLVALEVELAQELSLMLVRLQRSRQEQR